MTAGLAEVLDSVRSRVDYLRAGLEEEAGAGWHHCDAIGAEDLRAAIDAACGAENADRQVIASLLAQSYAHRVAAVSLAAFAVGLPWPAPTAVNTAVRLGEGKARALRFRTGELGAPDDAAGLAEALFPGHLVPFISVIRGPVATGPARLGERLLWANVAASCTAAFRAVEGAARDRNDAGEQEAIRRRAYEFLGRAPWLDGAGSFDDDDAGWPWQRLACCLWYRTSGGRTCEGCSLRQERS